MSLIKKKGVRGLATVFRRAGQEFLADNVVKLSASLAYYTIFSIGPLLLVVISLVGLFYEDRTAIETVNAQIYELVGPEAANGIINIISKIQEQQDAARFSVIGLVALVLGATTVFADIQDSINYIWSVRAKPRRGWLKLIKNRLLSFSMVVGLGFLLIASLMIGTITDVLTDKLSGMLNLEGVMLLRAGNATMLFIIVSFLFAVIYKVLPDAHIHWRDAAAGAMLTSFLFLAGKLIIGAYLAQSDIANVYGGAASVIILLSWVYYSSIILYFGAEFTKVYALTAGRGIRAASNAVFIVKQETQELSTVRPTADKLLHGTDADKPEKEDK